MHVYRVALTDDTRRFEPPDWDSFRDATRWDSLGWGEPFAGSWVPPALREMNVESTKGTAQRAVGDVSAIESTLSTILASSRVRDVLEGECKVASEWLAVETRTRSEYWLLNLTRLVDALDVERCGFVRFRSGRISRITTYAFLEDRVVDECMFKVTHWPYDLLCTDRLVDLSRQHAWTGMFFQPVWDSRLEPFPVSPGLDDVRERPEVFGPEGFVKGYEDAWPDEWRTNRP